MSGITGGAGAPGSPVRCFLWRLCRRCFLRCFLCERCLECLGGWAAGVTCLCARAFADAVAGFEVVAAAAAFIESPPRELRAQGFSCAATRLSGPRAGAPVELSGHLS